MGPLDGACQRRPPGHRSGRGRHGAGGPVPAGPFRHRRKAHRSPGRPTTWLLPATTSPPAVTPRRHGAGRRFRGTVSSRAHAHGHGRRSRRCVTSAAWRQRVGSAGTGGRRPTVPRDRFVTAATPIGRRATTPAVAGKRRAARPGVTPGRTWRTTRRPVPRRFVTHATPTARRAPLEALRDIGRWAPEGSVPRDRFVTAATPIGGQATTPAVAGNVEPARPEGDARRHGAGVGHCGTPALRGRPPAHGSPSRPAPTGSRTAPPSSASSGGSPRAGVVSTAPAAGRDRAAAGHHGRQGSLRPCGADVRVAWRPAPRCLDPPPSPSP